MAAPGLAIQSAVASADGKTWDETPGSLCFGPVTMLFFIDEVHLSSEEAFYGGPASPNFPAGGNAFGQNALPGAGLEVGLAFEGVGF